MQSIIGDFGVYKRVFSRGMQESGGNYGGLGFSR